MFANRMIACKNKDGIEMMFTEKGFGPFLLAKAEGIYDVNNTVNVSENTMSDGAEYQGSVMNFRNIVLTLIDKSNFAANRDMLDVLFIKDQLGTLTAYDDGHIRTIDYYVESIETTAEYNARYTTISLICPNPYFYDQDAQVVRISNIMNDFEFLHEFLEEGEEFSHFNPNKVGVIINDTAENNIGLTITFTTTGDALNPSVVKIETGERIKIGNELKPFFMSRGDEVIITTTNGDKNIYYKHDGMTEEINHYLTEDSIFFQLMRGRNTIGYTADMNVNYLTITINYRFKHVRA